MPVRCRASGESPRRGSRHGEPALRPAAAGDCGAPAGPSAERGESSEDAPIACGLLISGVLREAGLPAGVLNVVTNDRADAAEVVSALIADPRVRMVDYVVDAAVFLAALIRATRVANAATWSSS